METLADSWVLWLICAVGVIAYLIYHRQNNQNFQAMYNSSEDFSPRYILFSLKKGEADIFFGYVAAMISFSLFLAGFVRWVQYMY